MVRAVGLTSLLEVCHEYTGGGYVIWHSYALLGRGKVDTLPPYVRQKLSHYCNVGLPSGLTLPVTIYIDVRVLMPEDTCPVYSCDCGRSGEGI